MVNEYKVYIPVLVIFSEKGDLQPKTITWIDDRIFEIDNVLEVRPAVVHKAGSCGTGSQ